MAYSPSPTWEKNHGKSYFNEIAGEVENPDAAGVPGELERASHERTGGAGVFDFTGDFVEVALAVVLLQLLLRIEQIHLAWATVHEKMNHRFGLG